MTDQEHLGHSGGPLSVEEMQAERQAWVEFERRDGFINGFLVGVMFMALCTVIILLMIGGN